MLNREKRTEIFGADTLNLVVIFGAALLLLGAIIAPPQVVRSAMQAQQAETGTVTLALLHQVS